MRKRVLAMVLAGLMMFETGNVAIASEIKGIQKFKGKICLSAYYLEK